MALLQEQLLVGAFFAALASLTLLFTVSCKIVYSARQSPLTLGFLPLLFAAVFQLVFVMGPVFMESQISNDSAPLPARYGALEDSVVAIPPDFTAADLHSDALMWMRRDLLSRSTIGHVDLPRLEDGSFKLQVFALVISAPRGLNVDSNARPSSFLQDHVWPKMILERWPVRAWKSHLQRALVQCHRLHRLSSSSGGRLSVARTAFDLCKPGIQGILALEGATSLEHNLSNLEVLFEAGLRILGPAHFFDTEVGGSQAGVIKGGLTAFGRKVVSRMKALDMVVDLAHSSDRLIEDMRNIPNADRPCTFLSHTGVYSVCPSARNYDDAHLKMVAEMGGIIGIALFDPALCNRNDLIQSWVASVKYVVELVGVEHVALGSDFDGAVITSVHAGQSRLLYAALVHDGRFSSADASAIMGRNTISFFRKCLYGAKHL